MALPDHPSDDKPDDDFLGVLYDDLNTPAALALLHEYAKDARQGSMQSVRKFKAAARLLGVYENEKTEDFLVGYEVVDRVDDLVAQRNAARKTKNFKEADRIRDQLKAMGVELEDTKDGKTKWKVAR